MTEVYLIRHGETLFNALRRIQGISDSPLTAKGEERAVELGDRLKLSGITFDAVYSSDLGRARATARLILSRLDQNELRPIETQNLREVSYGMYEGLPGNEVWERIGRLADLPELHSTSPDNLKIKSLPFIKKADTTGLAENFNDVQSRIGHLVKTFSESGKERILAVSHGLFINCIVAVYSKRKTLPPLPNTSVTKLILDGGEGQITYVGRTDHL
ncbi:MAG: histidine phosphatase family protein [Sporolactobacillus sp.]|jgi:probable phosphoglycerate mutase|nr:histidine phosphatase family protein [Sporolactobacillus sp.]